MKISEMMEELKKENKRIVLRMPMSVGYYGGRWVFCDKDGIAIRNLSYEATYNILKNNSGGKDNENAEEGKI